MTVLPSSISVTSLPGLGLSSPKTDKGSGFADLFDQKMGDEIQAPAQSLSAPFDASASSGSSQAITQLGKPLSTFLDSVNSLQLHADHMKEELATGGNVELHDVMAAQEKADLAVELTMQIRNKLVDAYQQVMQMSV